MVVQKGLATYLTYLVRVHRGNYFLALGHVVTLPHSSVFTKAIVTAFLAC